MCRHVSGGWDDGDALGGAAKRKTMSPGKFSDVWNVTATIGGQTGNERQGSRN